ncbi:hypothetical protein PFZ49_05100 [Microbacterium lacticum]|uniref:hypothetical protein n=1 Tax=Microbacterium lacticum TaxID=33885 RepID=UPI003A8A8844
MDTSTDTRTPARRRMLALIAVGALVLLATAIIGGFALSNATGTVPSAGGQGSPSTPGPSSTASSDATADPSNSPSAPPIDDAQEAATRVQAALASVTAALADPTAGDETSFAQAATGAYLTTLELQRQEWSDSGWHQEGAPLLTDPELQGPDADGRLTLSVCVDSSAVRVLDENGKDVRTSSGNPARSRTVFTLQSDGNTWLIADETFAEDPDC